MQVYIVQVSKVDPIKYILLTPILNGRVVMGYDFKEYDLIYIPQKVVKGKHWQIS